jgi:hypothetical protein
LIFDSLDEALDFLAGFLPHTPDLLLEPLHSSVDPPQLIEGPGILIEFFDRIETLASGQGQRDWRPR